MLNTKYTIIDTSWYVGVFCIVTLIILNGYLIIKLKKSHPNEYTKTGRPWPFWNDHRTLTFMIFVLKGNYKKIPDKNLVNLFNISRALTIVLLTSTAVFAIY